MTLTCSFFNYLMQKTNIIRDYLEDINEIPKSRMFWPREIWGKYADKLEVYKSISLLPFALDNLNLILSFNLIWLFRLCAVQDFKYEENSVKAVQCLNDLVTNALNHVEDCLKYMSNLRDLSIFRFCAIPQVWKNFSPCRISHTQVFPLCAHAFVPSDLQTYTDLMAWFAPWPSSNNFWSKNQLFQACLYEMMISIPLIIVYTREKKPPTLFNYTSSLYVHISSCFILKQWSIIAQLSTKFEPNKCCCTFLSCQEQYFNIYIAVII